MTKKQITNIKQVEASILILKSQHPKIFNISKFKTKRPFTPKQVFDVKAAEPFKHCCPKQII